MPCWLAQFSSVPCDGHLVKAHLVERQLIRKEFPYGAAITPDGNLVPAPRRDLWPTEAGIYVGMVPKRDLMVDPRSYVWACGGAMGNSGHHGAFDSYQLVVLRQHIPQETEQYCAELGLGWYLDRRYGLRNGRRVVHSMDGRHPEDTMRDGW